MKCPKTTLNSPLSEKVKLGVGKKKCLTTSWRSSSRGQKKNWEEQLTLKMIFTKSFRKYTWLFWLRFILLLSTTTWIGHNVTLSYFIDPNCIFEHFYILIYINGILNYYLRPCLRVISKLFRYSSTTMVYIIRRKLIVANIKLKSNNVRIVYKTNIALFYILFIGWKFS